MNDGRNIHTQMAATYTTCEDEHRLIRVIDNKSIVARLTSSSQYWDGQKVCTLSIDLDRPTLLEDSQNFYLYLPYILLIPLYGKKNGAG